MERWPIEGGKGIDDLLAAGGTPEVLTGDAARLAVDSIATAAAVDALTIAWTPSGKNGMVMLTAKLGDEVITVETLNVTKSKARTAFVASLSSGRPGIDAQAVEAELLGIAAELAGKVNATAMPYDLPELDVSCIVRPERFLTPDVCGLAVATMVKGHDGPAGQWLLFLRWADGRRQRVTLPPYIDASDARRLWIHPTPAEPTVNTPSGWSPSARAGWLKGVDPPDPADVFRRLCERIAYFLDLPKEHAPGITATLALWVMMTYAYHAWDAVPYLYVGGPIGSGKSRVFEILARLVFRPLGSSNMTAPALFRTLHTNGGTLLLDEAERLKQTQDPATQEMLSMLLAGYKRGGQATRLEAVGDMFKTVYFEVFGPKALACVAGLPPALSSRAIHIIMFRCPSGSPKPKRRIDADVAGWRRLRDDLNALAMEHGPIWLELPTRVDVCPAMSGRDFELWQPLLALASWVESHGAKGLLALLQAHALATIDAGKDDQVGDAEETLLRILADKRRAGAQPTPGELLREAQDSEPALFKSWSAKGVSNAFKRYGLRTVEIRGRKVYSRVTLADLQNIQATYGLSLGFERDESEETRA